jgi:hypothetical protein
MNKKLILLITCLLLLLSFATVQSQPAGISQFVGNRNGRVSVWGVNIQLHRLSLNEKIMPNQIRIIDHKYTNQSIIVWTLKIKSLLPSLYPPGQRPSWAGGKREEFPLFDNPFPVIDRQRACYIIVRVRELKKGYTLS